MKNLSNILWTVGVTALSLFVMIFTLSLVFEVIPINTATVVIEILSGGCLYLMIMISVQTKNKIIDKLYEKEFGRDRILEDEDDLLDTNLAEGETN